MVGFPRTQWKPRGFCFHCWRLPKYLGIQVIYRYIYIWVQTEHIISVEIQNDSAEKVWLGELENGGSVFKSPFHIFLIMLLNCKTGMITLFQWSCCEGQISYEKVLWKLYSITWILIFQYLYILYKIHIKMLH